MALLDEFPDLQEPIRGGKPVGRIVSEIFRFFLHSFIPVALVAGFFLGTANVLQNVPYPELVSAAYAALVPALIGAIIAKIWHDYIAEYVWIMGLLWFSIICVFVLDMPTGPGLCEHCGAGQKLWLSFFDLTQDSGLIGNNGRLIGTWPTLGLVGYSMGARAVIKKDRQREASENI
jgi:hypothetical protein